MHYVYVLVDDYFRYIEVCFLTYKNDDFKAFEIFLKRVQKEKKFLYIYFFNMSVFLPNIFTT